MSVRFPVKAGAHSAEDDDPPSSKQTVGIFDANGYWANLGNDGIFELPATVKNIDRIGRVVKMLNAAYEQGRSDQRRDFRECIGAKEETYD